MIPFKAAVASVVTLLLAACDRATTEREVGYRGKARVDAYLAAGRLLEAFGHEVRSQPGWSQPDEGVSMLVLPSPVMNAQGLVRQVGDWVDSGGHLVLLVERSESWIDDWSVHDFSPREEMAGALEAWLDEVGLEVRKREGEKLEARSVRFEEERYEVFAESGHEVRENGGRGRVFGSVTVGEGMVTVLTDARPFRNRHIDEHEHAALLVALARHSPYAGSVVFIRNARLSFLEMLWKRGWPALIGFAVVAIFWLWKNMPRFGPTAPVDGGKADREGYEHHLEALGGFHWRLDRGAGLLRPLRESLLERAQTQAASAGHRDDDLFAWMAARAGIPRERVERAMTHTRASDPATFTRLVSDLQALHLSLP